MLPSASCSRVRFAALAVLLVAIAFLGCGLGAQAPAVEGRRLEVLFVGAPTRNGPHHDPITRYRALKRGLGVDGINLTYTEDPATAFTASMLPLITSCPGQL